MIWGVTVLHSEICLRNATCPAAGHLPQGTFTPDRMPRASVTPRWRAWPTARRSDAAWPVR